ncbi:MAG: bifunctional diguanylate cyclase/phosphodiesterase [Lautropia sp.]|nr:bifunctional diguanylate cyclase/phosphodiesterase [Lautropia sp.]
MNPEVHISISGNASQRKEDALIQKQNTVLLFDTDVATRQMLAHLLDTQRLGNLCIAESPDDVETIVESGHSLALLLIHLDSTDNARLAWLSGHLKDSAWRRLPIILLTRHDPAPLWRIALSLNLTDVLQQPLDEAALLLKLRQCLGLKIYHDRLLRQDLLTGLTNHTGFMRRLETILQPNAPPYTLMLLDLDRFRQLNDGLGHCTGDAFLKAISQRLDNLVSRHTGPERRRRIRTASPWLARTGADRFMALLPGRPGDPAHTRCVEDLQQMLALPLHIDGRELFISASIGMAVFPEHATDYNQLTRYTEQAMALAKRRGGHRIEYFDPTRKRPPINALTLENHLRHAIRHKELQLRYQPKVCSRTLCITGVEALIRWYHRELGLILPEHFVPIAERSGLIADIGAWALNRACRQAREWLDAGLPPLKIAVNVSAAQTQRGNLVDIVRQALQDSRLPPELLTLELTETLLIENGENANLLIRQLKQLGLSLSLDDFGTGYSSLTYLHTLPFDEIKIDRSFIQGLPNQAVSRAIVNAILALAHGLKLDVVAEGIERPEEFSCLQQTQLDCTLQGNLFCPPLSPGELQLRLQHNTCFRPPSLVQPPTPDT